jgi:hypothetical protein
MYRIGCGMVSPFRLSIGIMLRHVPAFRAGELLAARTSVWTSSTSLASFQSVLAENRH